MKTQMFVFRVALKFCLILLLFSTLTARAAPVAYNWEYRFSEDVVLSGMLVGELRNDLDIIDVLSVSMSSYSLAPSFTFSTDVPAVFSYVSLSGLHANFAVLSHNDVFPFQWWFVSESSDVVLPGGFSSIAIVNDPDIPGTFSVPYAQDKWGISAKAVASPATLLLVCTGLLGLIVRRCLFGLNLAGLNLLYSLSSQKSDAIVT